MDDREESEATERGGDWREGEAGGEEAGVVLVRRNDETPTALNCSRLTGVGRPGLQAQAR